MICLNLVNSIINTITATPITGKILSPNFSLSSLLIFTTTGVTVIEVVGDAVEVSVLLTVADGVGVGVSVGVALSDTEGKGNVYQIQ